MRPLLYKLTVILCLPLFLLACASSPPTTGDKAGSAKLGAGGRPVGENWSRSPVYGSKGMAATAHPLASQVALDILKDGGSAVDAAIAANAALGLMEPTGNGIGGDIFVIVWDPKSRQLFGKLPMSQILAPTIDYARSGFPVSPVIAYYLQRSWSFFSKTYADSPHLDSIRDTWFPGDRAPEAGEISVNKDLGDTLETIALDGRDAFYKGSLARRMAEYFDGMEGGLAYEDFSAHRGEWVSPGSVNYRGYDLYELPPNGQGFAALQMLSILKNVDLTQWQRGSAETFHYMVEAKRLAFEDVARYYADPEYADIPLTGLLSDQYGSERFALIDPARASDAFAPGEPKLEGAGDTTYLTVADQSGMMVSLIQSNYRGMGSGMVAANPRERSMTLWALYTSNQAYPPKQLNACARWATKCN